MKIAIIVGIVWIIGIVFFLALFKAAARGDRMLEEDFKEKEHDEE